VPAFQPRARPEILRDMIARVVARSTLTGVTRNNALFHVLAAAASEDAEQYFQMARLRDLFSIDKASGSDLDARAKEIVPGTLTRRGPVQATGNVTFSRPGTTGTVAIPTGTTLAASDAQGQINFQTTSAGSILAGSTSSGLVPVAAVEAGARGNVAAGSISQFVSRVAGVPVVTNASALTNGQDRESDASFRARLRAFVQGMSRGTVSAIESFATNVVLASGQRVIFANLKEPVIPTGTVSLYIDDGTGNVETFDSSLIGSPEVLLASAIGGEVALTTTNKPVRDDGSLVVELDTGSGYTTLVRNTDYVFDPAGGRITFTVALSAGDAVRAQYRYYTGLIQEVQKVVDGDPLNPLVYPGVRPAGIQVLVLAPSLLSQSVTATISVLSGYDVTSVAANVSTAIQSYINNLPIGDDVIASELIERAMGVTGMFNFKLQSLTGSSPAADQIVLDDQVARISAASITLV
jgi:uncharacterized phage protein gp47/JayE